jgi:hypothetical protein
VLEGRYKCLEYYLDLGWGAMAVGLVHELTRSKVLDYKYFYAMARTKVLFGRQMYFFFFHPFIVRIRKNIKMWEQSLGLGWGAMAVGFVHELTRSNVLD